MAYYAYRTQGKTQKNFKEKSDQTLEGTVELAPNVDYKLQEVYGFVGLGGVFNGNYRIKGITKKISVDGMTVSAEVVKM